MTEERLLQLMEHRPTPLYLFDGEELARRTALLRQALPEGVGLCYAVKANPFLAGELAPLVDRLELCSPGELGICQRLGLPQEKFVISGVHKEAPVIRELLTRQGRPCLYTVESLGQFHLLRREAVTAGKRISLLLRLTSGNQFGMDPGEVESLLTQFSHDPFVELRGIQYFSGTQKTSLRRLGRELDWLDRLFPGLASPAGQLPRGAGAGAGASGGLFPPGSL